MKVLLKKVTATLLLLTILCSMGCAYRFNYMTGKPGTGVKIKEWRHITSWGWSEQRVVDLEEIVVKVGWRDVNGTWKARWEVNGEHYSNLTRAEDVADTEHEGSVEDVLKAVKGVKADLPVILDVEPAVPMEDVIDVYDLCRDVGLERVQFAASVGT